MDSPKSTSTTTTLGSSNKENRPPKCRSSRSTSPTDYPNTTTEDGSEPDNFGAILPDDLTYEAFHQYYSNDERRADLYEEIKEGGGSDTILTLLRIFHQTIVYERSATKLRLSNLFAHNRLDHLATDLQQYASLTFDKDAKSLTAFLFNFSHDARTNKALLAENDSSILGLAATYHHTRTAIFGVLQQDGVAWLGNRSFVKHGYLRPTRWDTTRDNGWNVSADEWNRRGKKIQEETTGNGWVESEEETCRRWENAKWTEVRPDQKNTTFFDPQA